MEGSMRELLERSFQGDKVIAYIDSIEADNMLLTKERDALAKESEMKCELNHELQKQVDKLAYKLAEITEHTPCSSACPIGNPEECDCECNRVDKWKEWAKKDEG